MDLDRFGVGQFLRDNPIQMEPDEIALVADVIRNSPSDSLMAEWGSGASSVRWLAEMRGNQRLVSIEHDRGWFDRIRAATDAWPDLRRRHQYVLAEPAVPVERGYGAPSEENPIGLDAYLIPEEWIFDADIFFIDGIARGSCAMLVRMRATKLNPIIYLHDWYGRQDWYSWAVGLFPRAVRVGTTLLQLTLR